MLDIVYSILKMTLQGYFLPFRNKEKSQRNNTIVEDHTTSELDKHLINVYSHQYVSLSVTALSSAKFGIARLYDLCIPVEQYYFFTHLKNKTKRS